jgi:hypothetical protein
MSLPQQKYLLDIRSPFTRADARSAGITVKELISNRYQKVFYNLYVSADVVLTPQVRAQAALRLASRDSYASRNKWERDIYRREELDLMDCRLLIVTSRGIYNEPHRTLERVPDALRERGVRVPSRFKNEWRRHFPTVA